MPVLLSVRLTPRGGRNAIDRVEENVVYARVAAPPVNGAANESLCALLAAALHVPKSAVSIRSGANARRKRVEVSGIEAPEALARLQEIGSQTA